MSDQSELFDEDSMPMTDEDEFDEKAFLDGDELDEDEDDSDEDGFPIPENDEIDDYDA